MGAAGGIPMCGPAVIIRGISAVVCVCVCVCEGEI